MLLYRFGVRNIDQSGLRDIMIPITHRTWVEMRDQNVEITEIHEYSRPIYEARAVPASITRVVMNREPYISLIIDMTIDNRTHLIPLTYNMHDSLDDMFPRGSFSHYIDDVSDPVEIEILEDICDDINHLTFVSNRSTEHQLWLMRHLDQRRPLSQDPYPPSPYGEEENTIDQFLRANRVRTRPSNEPLPGSPADYQ